MTLLTERLQQLAGIKPLYEIEADEGNLPLNDIKKEVDDATDKIEDNLESIEQEITEDPNKLQKLVQKLKPYFEQVKQDLTSLQDTKEKKEKLQNSMLLSWKSIGTLSAAPYILKLLGIGPDKTETIITNPKLWGLIKGKEKLITSTEFMEGFLVVAGLMAVFKVYLYFSKVNAPSDNVQGTGVDSEGNPVQEQMESFSLDDIDNMIFSALDNITE